MKLFLLQIASQLYFAFTFHAQKFRWLAAPSHRTICLPFSLNIKLIAAILKGQKKIKLSQIEHFALGFGGVSMKKLKFSALELDQSAKKERLEKGKCFCDSLWKILWFCFHQFLFVSNTQDFKHFFCHST